MEEKIKDFGKVIQDLKDRVSGFERRVEWTEIYNNDLKHIRLYETYTNKGKHELKCEAVLKNCDSLRLLQLNIDNVNITRQQWETGELGGIKELESYSDIKLIEYWIKLPWPLSNRVFQGVQWWDYSKEEELYTLVFKSTEPDRHPINKDCTEGTCFTIMQIQQHGDNDQRVVIYTSLSLGGWIPDMVVALWKEKLRTRMKLYEDIAKNDLMYNTIYSNVVCPECDREWPVNTEKCRMCHNKFDF